MMRSAARLTYNQVADTLGLHEDAAGQLVDATIVSAPKQRNSKAEKRALKEGRIPDGWAEKPAPSA